MKRIAFAYTQYYVDFTGKNALQEMNDYIISEKKKGHKIIDSYQNGEMYTAVVIKPVGNYPMGY